MQLLFRLGKNPNLSHAEIGTYLTARGVLFTVDYTSPLFSLISIESEISIANTQYDLGGTIKIARVIERGVVTKDTLRQLMASHLASIEKKVFFGISLLGDVPVFMSKQSMDAFALSVKKEISGSARYVSSKERELSSVIVANEKLLTHGGEFILAQVGGETIVAVTEAVQDFESFAVRDYDRPRVDARSGMLPPKLALMLLNLAGVSREGKVWDPFCGSGTLLQEAALHGFSHIVGSDISPKAISDARANLEWATRGLSPVPQYELHESDVREMGAVVSDVAAIITEPYLGPALRGNETAQQMTATLRELEQLYRDAFKVYAQVLGKGGVVVSILPAFRLRNEVVYLDILKFIEKFGFVLQKFDRIIDEDFRSPLTYYRPDQRVLREVMVWKKA